MLLGEPQQAVCRTQVCGYERREVRGAGFWPEDAIRKRQVEGQLVVLYPPFWAAIMTRRLICHNVSMSRRE
ncbi:hypothetical protein B5V02_24925 [Mesorhizobium kowhaii]|uniref:Uncharacterized protein n=1 Tax=Mesorhizobium kowhaii TaxID=1300272 RepID=A0A2W7BYF9_9HYPH|nr:hypothetical protein B5V02_24925 [Mesorhizobium kowhaii]